MAYVAGDRVLGMVVWPLVIASGRVATITAISFALSAAMAFAVACACVFVHYRVVGPLPVQRSFVMAAIALPIFVLATVATARGIEGFVRYFSIAPVQAALHYAAAFFALPLAALVMAPGGQPAAVQGATTESAAVILFRIFVALVSAVLFLLGCVLLIFVTGFGAGHMSGEDQAIMAVTLIALFVFAFCFLCSVGLFRRILKTARVVVAVAVVPVIGYLLTEGKDGAWATIPVLLYVAIFWGMCRAMEARA